MIPGNLFIQGAKSSGDSGRWDLRYLKRLPLEVAFFLLSKIDFTLNF